MFLPMQSLGYGLAALLFCFAVVFLCQKVKSLAYRILRRSKRRDTGRGKRR